MGGRALINPVPHCSLFVLFLRLLSSGEDPALEGDKQSFHFYADASFNDHGPNGQALTQNDSLRNITFDEQFAS